MAFYVGLAYGILLPNFDDVLPGKYGPDWIDDDGNDICHDETVEYKTMSDEARRVAEEATKSIQPPNGKIPGLYGQIGSPDADGEYLGFLLAASGGVGYLHDVADMSPRYLGLGHSIVNKLVLAHVSEPVRNILQATWKSLELSLNAKGLGGFLRTSPNYLLILGYD